MIARLWQTLLFTLLLIPGLGQWYNPEKVDKKAQVVYRDAISLLRDGEWHQGKAQLHRAIAMQPRYVEAWLSLMSAYGERKIYDSAAIAFETAWKLDSVFSADLLLPYSINLAGLGRFAEARRAAERYLATVPAGSRAARAAEYRLDSYRFALDMDARLKDNNYQFVPVNLGDSINSPRSEYYPSFTIDDSLLVFTRRMQGIREDFFVSRRENGVYSHAVPVSGALNEMPSKGGINISADGDWLIFAGNFSGQGFGDFDLYQCLSTPQGWSVPKNLGGNINTEFWESSPSISPDKQALYFSSNRPGGYGGKDLYVSYRRPDGSWTPAENMGPDINTPADDLAPFIHADNQTLYFTSGGHPGYGGSDIYVIRKGPGGKWSKPENLGYPVNTIDDEGSLIVAADGRRAYFASFRSDSRGGLDLYSFELPAHARPRRTLWVKGRVYDAVTSKGLPSAIELRDLRSGEVLQQVVTDETGNYLVTLPEGSKYTFTVSRKNYLFFSDDFDLTSARDDSAYRKDIPLQPIAVNTTMELRNILFETNAFRLEPESHVELDKLVQLLKDNPTLRVEIGGHTDNVGRAADNLLLSQRRAKSVVDYLVSKGIESARLSAKGYGSTQPVADNATEAGRARNRRTEMRVTGN